MRVVPWRPQQYTEVLELPPMRPRLWGRDSRLQMAGWYRTFTCSKEGVRTCWDEVQGVLRDVQEVYVAGCGLH